jgi:4-hydroxy-3-methylbut-2-enyl diphosphate reductase
MEDVTPDITRDIDNDTNIKNQESQKSGDVEIIVAKSAGVCFGVERALNLSEKALGNQTGPISSLGPLIHNPQTVEALASRGLNVAKNIDDISGTVVFRSHGVTVDVQKAAGDRGLKIVDATCPLVKVPQRLAQKLSEAGYFVVLVGDKNHPEVQGVESYVGNKEVAVVKGPEEIANLPQKEKVGVICQTTLKKSVFLEVVAECQKRFPEVKIHNTICGATKDRQDAAYELAGQVECVVVIGGRNSSNTQKLYDICNDLTSKAYLIETEEEIQPQWFDGIQKIGITAGASTPHALIDRVRERISVMVSEVKSL